MTPGDRLKFYVNAWGVTVDRTVDATCALVALGHRGRHPVALKVIRAPGDEWRSGQVLEAFGGRGMVRVIEQGAGAVLLERLLPGTALSSEVADDERATGIIADIIQRHSPSAPPSSAPQVARFAESFDRYLGGGLRVIPPSYVRSARRAYVALCASQGTTRLLHGDLHHDNVLLDERRGWVAIDPKGVVGEVEYELGACLRNPVGQPELFTSPAVIERRVAQFSKALGLDRERILTWAFAQAVLAALWEIEDDGALTTGRGWVRMAEAVGSTLGIELDA